MMCIWWSKIENVNVLYNCVLFTNLWLSLLNLLRTFLDYWIYLLLWVTIFVVLGRTILSRKPEKTFSPVVLTNSANNPYRDKFQLEDLISLFTFTYEIHENMNPTNKNSSTVVGFKAYLLYWNLSIVEDFEKTPRLVYVFWFSCLLFTKYPISPFLRF